MHRQHLTSPGRKNDSDSHYRAQNADQLCGSLKEKTAHPHLVSKGILLWNSLTFHIGLLYISWEPDTPKQTKNASEEGGRERERPRGSERGDDRWMEKHIRFIQVFSISSFFSDSNGYVSNIDNEVYSVGTETGKSVALTSKPNAARGLGLLGQDGNNKSSVMEKRVSWASCY